MKIIRNYVAGLLPAILVLFMSFQVFAQETVSEKIYDLQLADTVRVTPSKDLQRTGSCWSNAGTALLEAELIRTGKGEIDLAEMDFIHNSYLKKADVYLESKGEIRVGENGMAYDVIKMMGEYGMAPESAYMTSDKNMMDPSSGEMDAILRGTLNVVLQVENGEFSERWQNTYDAALSRYIGETRIEFTYDNEKYTPESFAKKSGLNAENYVMLTSDADQEMYIKFVPEFKDNWAKDEFYNVPVEDLIKIIKSAVENGYTVIWYGVKDTETIFEEESVAIIPAGKMPGEPVEEEEEKITEPVPEKEINQEIRQETFEIVFNKSLDYLQIFGLSKDKKENEYYIAKEVCISGDKQIHISVPYLKQNTVYILLNKSGIPSGFRKKLGI